MQKYTLIRSIKTNEGRNFKFKRTIELPGTPQLEWGIQLVDGTFGLVRCFTYCETGRIYVLLQNEPLITDNDVDISIAEYEQDGWVLSE